MLRVGSIGLVVLGFGALLIVGVRGVGEIAHQGRDTQVSRGRTNLRLDECVEAALKREVPRGAPVFPWRAQSPTWWSFAVGPMSAPDHPTVKHAQPGAYAVRVVSPRAKPRPAGAL